MQSLVLAGSGSSSITANTRSAPARAENTLLTCMDISLMGRLNCLEKFKNTVRPAHIKAPEHREQAAHTSCKGIVDLAQAVHHRPHDTAEKLGPNLVVCLRPRFSIRIPLWPYPLAEYLWNPPSVR